MKTYKVYLWGFSGYNLDEFITKADSEEEALDIVVADLVNKNQSRYFYEEEEIERLLEEDGNEDYTAEEYANDMGLIYIDATLSGADRPVYIDGQHIRIIESFDIDKTPLYSSYVIIDGTGADLGSYEDFEDAKHDAIEYALENKYGTYEIFGCDKDGYYDYDESLVYSTDEDEDYITDLRVSRKYGY